MDYQKLFGSKLDRRRLLGNLGLMGAGAVITACGAGAVTPPETPDQPDTPDTPAANLDPAILNFALNLEYLEAAFYLAAVGRIAEIQAIGGDAVIGLPEGFDGSTSIKFDNAEVAAYADEIATDELNHVNFLRGALEAAGASVADRPELDLSASFAGAAEAAGILPAGEGAAFNPFANELFFLHGAFIFEDVGVTAYSGAAPAITDAATVLKAAAGILAVEAYHAGQIRTLLYNRRDTTAVSAVGDAPAQTVEEVVAKISAARASLSGAEDDQGIVIDDAANINPTDEFSIAFARTPRQVANIVFLAADATTGGFFPDGLAFPEDLAEDLGTLLAL